MSSISYSGQSFAIGVRRIWILGASLQYARIAPADWAARLEDVRAAGFNTVATTCPWVLHEPRRGRYTFEDRADVRRFVELAAEADLRVILGVGPYVGAGYDGGGIPGWMTADPAVHLREKHDVFVDRAARWFRKLFGEVSGLLVTKGGPIVLVQIEHDWACGNDVQATAYLGELSRVLRESGVNVPLTNSNNLWCDPVGTVDTWCGEDDLLANLRQLRVVQPEAPRVVSRFNPAARTVWGGADPEPMPADVAMRRVAEILASGSQPIVTPFHAGTNFGFLGGRLPGPDGGVVTTSAAAGAPVGEAGARTDSFRLVRRVVAFANNFEHLFADLDPEYQPVTIDPTPYQAGRTSGKASATLSVVPLRGAGGKVVFVFSDRRGGATTLLMQNGIRIPIDLGDQPVGWYVTDVDLQGRARLDYANLCPLAMVDRRIVVLYGPARANAVFAVNGTPIEATVPTGPKPLVIEHKGLVFAILNEKQVDSARSHDGALYVGVSGFDAEGAPISEGTSTRVYRIDGEGELASIKAQQNRLAAAEAKKTPRTAKLDKWHVGSCAAYADGTSPRFASLAGPADLPTCGSIEGYGWYRVRLKASSAKTHNVHASTAGDRAHFYLDGKLHTIYGDGPGADRDPFTLKLAKGEHMLVGLVDNAGRLADGDDIGRPVGISRHLYEIKSLAGVRGKNIETDPADPFALRGFVYGATPAHASDSAQVEWTFTHLRKTPILVDLVASAPGTLLLNETPIRYFAGDHGVGREALVLDPADEAFKRGKNTLRFAPLPGHRDEVKGLSKSVSFFECVAAITDGADWSFAKWEPPAPARFKPASSTEGASHKGTPTWWRSQFETPESPLPKWFDTTGLSKGQLYVNGENVGRYFAQTRTGKAVGPQQRLLLPDSWLLSDKPNEVMIFDEHGFAPHKTKIVLSTRGDLD